MIFETRRLILRPWTEDDAESLYEYAKDARVGPSAGWAVHTSVGNSREIIATVLGVEGTFAITVKGDGKAVGSIGVFKSPVCGENELELGYWIGVPFWGNGYVPEASGTLLDWCFRVKGCPRMWCSRYDGNHKSRRVMEKCGFHSQFSGEEDVPVLGERRIVHYYSLDRDEWYKRVPSPDDRSMR